MTKTRNQLRQHGLAEHGLAHPFLVAFVLVLIGLALGYWAWAQSKNAAAAQATPGGVLEVVRGTYSPPFIPVTLAVDSSGQLQVSAGSAVVTPAGTFSVEWERQGVFYLEVTLGPETRFYQLGQNKFKIYLPNSLDGNTSVRYDGEGNVRIIVPNPGEVCFPDQSGDEEPG